MVEFDWIEADDANTRFLATIETLDQSSFARLSRRLVDLAKPVLDEAGLPFDPEPSCVVRPDGTWALLDEAVISGRSS